MEEKLNYYDMALAELLHKILSASDNLTNSGKKREHLLLRDVNIYDEDLLLINMCGTANMFLKTGCEVLLWIGWFKYHKLKKHYIKRSSSKVFPLKRYGKAVRALDYEKKVISATTLLDSKICEDYDITWDEIFKEYYSV